MQLGRTKEKCIRQVLRRQVGVMARLLGSRNCHHDHGQRTSHPCLGSQREGEGQLQHDHQDASFRLTSEPRSRQDIDRYHCRPSQRLDQRAGGSHENNDQIGQQSYLLGIPACRLDEDEVQPCERHDHALLQGDWCSLRTPFCTPCLIKAHFGDSKFRSKWVRGLAITKSGLNDMFWVSTPTGCMAGRSIKLLQADALRPEETTNLVGSPWAQKKELEKESSRRCPPSGAPCTYGFGYEERLDRSGRIHFDEGE